MSTTRIRNVIITLGIVIVASIGSWYAGSRIKSPAEAAARTSPPTPAPILVPIEERQLAAKIVTRGTARFGSPHTISVFPSPLKPEINLIFRLLSEDDPVEEGEVLMVASGRPLFVLLGGLPVYRDLTPGVSGDDVKQLEAGLQRLGFDPGMVDGVFDDRTGEAVSAWYISAGFEPFGPTANQVKQIRELENYYAILINEKLAAEEDAAEAQLAVEAARAMAAYSIKKADEDNLSAVQLAGALEILAAENGQKAAMREAARLQKEAEALEADLEALRRKTGTQVPADEVVFIPNLPAKVMTVHAAIGDEAPGPLVTITDNTLYIDTALPLSETPLVKPGMAVQIDETELGLEAAGVVHRIANTPGTNGVDGFHYYCEILVDETQLSLGGFSLRVTIPVETTQSAVTVVPVSALFFTADGSTYIQVVKDGVIEAVSVKPGLAADGYVEVTPASGTIQPGQLVVIGFDNEP